MLAHRGRRLAQLTCLATCGVIAWWACAPIVGTMPSPAPLPGDPDAWAYTGTLSYGPTLVEPYCHQQGASCATSLELTPSVGAVDLALSKRMAERFTMGAHLGGGIGAGLYLGATSRYFVVDQDTLRVGIEGQFGFLWAAIGVPVAVRLNDNLWLHTAPSVGYRLAHQTRLPVGLSIDQSDGLRLGFEVAGGYGPNVLADYVDGGTREPWGVWVSTGLTFH